MRDKDAVRQMRDERRRALVRCAIAELQDRGLKYFTVSAVAGRAKASKPTVYYYFDGGDDALLVEVYRELLRRESVAIRDGKASAGALRLIRDIEARVGRENCRVPETVAFWSALDALPTGALADYASALLPPLHTVESANEAVA